MGKFLFTWCNNVVRPPSIIKGHACVHVGHAYHMYMHVHVHVHACGACNVQLGRAPNNYWHVANSSNRKPESAR